MWQAHDGMGWWMLYGGLIWLAFWAVVIYLVVSVATGRRGGATPERETPLDIAKRRYASGELTRDEFERLREDLTGRSARERTGAT